MDEKNNLIFSPSLFADCHEGTFSYSDFQLLLSPLEAITDEECVECYNLFSGPDFDMMEITNDKKKITWVKDIIKADMMPYHIADFLRSKFYMIKYAGIDLFECGIAIDKTKQHA